MAALRSRRLQRRGFGSRLLRACTWRASTDQRGGIGAANRRASARVWPASAPHLPRAIGPNIVAAVRCVCPGLRISEP
eukprot:6210221-Pleurochrysis_carterae.AAC.1